MTTMTLSRPVRLLAILMLLASLGACQTTKNLFNIGDSTKDKIETLEVEPLYALGKEAMDDENYDKAERVFTRLVARFPYGELSEKAQIDLAFAQYKLSKPEESVSTLTRFIKTYPTNPQIDYAYYLKALVNFDRENRWLAKIARLDVSARDLGAATQSYNDFNEVIRRFPTSQYAEEARQRMIYLRNRLALHDLNVGLYYYQREAYVSAAGRARYIVETYPQSAYDADAVALLAASYAKLGQDTLAADAKRVLESNYPEHPYLGKGWPERRSRWSQLNPFAGEVRR